nr:transcription elongation factor A N-terminal and central domain-containing protein isoform X1 [Pogona vitticeps]XP_020642363.1 transcription elongation factor A N-terminal and central domain-containing protein isoform X1 [Pogona vitticeps]XP_020642364.1 transcription elongation factor A N-terminal and central domain-containing protein isoform X1 [Pogona vitticeps]XP_020642365.1 transcription elongation factor A N-terminal and central domain-containing protein isoform X1 [Pogona vitticeps]
MSDKKEIMTRASCIETLLSGKRYQDIGNHLAYLETVDVTVDNLQETDIAEAVFRILKNCPSMVLKNKAKHLLSRWKTLYKNHCNQSIQEKQVPDNAKEDLNHLQIVSEDINSSEKLNQHEKSSPASSSSWLPSENHSNNAESHVQKDQANLQLLSQSGCVNETNLQQHHALALRFKCTKLLYEALIDSATSTEDSEKHRKIAEEIEQHIFALYAKNDRKYKNCIRSKVSNLKNPKNSHLKHNLFIGVLSPETFAGMSAMEMAYDELKQLRASYTESAVREHQLPQNISGSHTNKIKCRHCEKFDCTVTVIARGALFLPGWVRSTNPDEQMMTYVICNECGEQWYHSRWNCL